MSKVSNHLGRRFMAALGLAVSLALAGLAHAGSFEIVPIYGTGITPATQSAIQYAVDSWNNWLTNSNAGPDSTTEITFSYESISGSTLGESSPAWFKHSGGKTLNPAQYTLATGDDPFASDGTIRLNSNMPWSTDTSVKAAANTYDMASVVMHEIGHHIGFWPTYNSTTGTWGQQTGTGGNKHYELSPWDTFLRDQNGNAPTAGSGGSFDVRGTVTFVGTQAMSVYGGPVPIYAPYTYVAGSSLSHVDFINGDNPSGLMYYGVSTGVTRRGMADYEQAMFTDLGWTFSAPTLVHARGYGAGIWHDGSQWDYGLAPTSATDVRIDAASAIAYTVQVKKNSYAASVVVSGLGVLSIYKGQLAVTGLVQLDNTANIDPSAYGGSLSAGSLDVAVAHSATLNHYGNQVAVQGRLRVGVGAGMSGTYTKTGGSLQAGELQVGAGGSGTFAQYSGSTTAGTVRVGAAGSGSGYCSISSGTLQADHLYVTNGTLDVGSAGIVTVNNSLELGSLAQIAALDGAQLQMAGASLVNYSTTPANFLGLGVMSVIYSAGDANTTFEVAGQDQGRLMAGLNNNFALKSLSIGGASPMSLRLVDSVDNSAGTGGEALYVSNLTLGQGATLDLNGLHLYYKSGQIDPTAQVLNGVLLRMLLPGDATEDGYVNFSDYLVMEQHFNQPGDWTFGDFDGNGTVNFSDYLTLEQNFNQSSAGSVPEPLTLTLLLAGAGLSIRRFRR